MKEDAVSGYKSSGEANSSNNYTITNTFTPESININGEKTWKAVDDLTIVPTITITLESSLDGETWTAVEGKVVELAAGNSKYEFNDLPKYATNGEEYKYHVVETKVDGYVTSYGEENSITNTYDPGEIAIKVTKTWVNVDPNNEKVPEVNIVLKQNGTEVSNIVLDKDNKYTHTFEKLDKYAPTGKAYEYTVEEVLSEDVVGYTKKITSGKDGFTVENTFDRDATVDVPFNKVWENVTDDSKVPEIKLHLYQSGVELKDKVVTLNGGVKTDRVVSYVFKDLPKYATEGKEYVYTVKEDTIMGYTSSGEANTSNKYTITNTFTPESINISGKKSWASVDKEDLSKVPTITIKLESSTDGIMWTAVEGKVLQLAAGTTSYDFNNLPKYSVEGNKYQYRVVEDAVNGYKTAYDLEYNITNTYTPGETTVKVTKTWVNVDPNKDRVPEVKIILKQDGTEFDNIVLNEDNGYTYTFEKLDKYAPTGTEYEYTVEEVLSDDVVGYTKEITSGEDGFTVENTFDRDITVDVPFNKVWENVSKDSEVPAITLHLYQNGVELEDKVVTLNGGIKPEGKEAYVFKDLPKYATEGKEYVYTVKEDTINGYTSSGEASAYNNYTITNTYDGGEKVIISGKKTWVNVKNGDKVPDITIRVLRDGKEIHSIVVPSGTTTYEISTKEMVKYAEDGHEYKYELTEDKIDGFESVRDGYNFTNTNTVKEAVGGISHINTGDNNMIILYAGLAILSLSLISMITARKRKNARKVK